jgi:D-beta-D-heptose 7-phosphate kinase / D-beta-D-heptose 1-phosphate adenosyltransferase
MKPLLVIGDALLDLDLEGLVRRSCPDAPAPVVEELQTLRRPGGAALAAALAAADGREVTLITALARDDAGVELARLLRARGVDVIDLGLAGQTVQKMRVLADGRTLVRLDRGDGTHPGNGPLMASARAAIGWAETILVSDYGRGIAAQPAIRRELAAREKMLVWDPHPNGPPPIANVTLATPNRAEAERFAGRDPAEQERDRRSQPPAHGRLEASCGRLLARRWQARHVCVTCASEGALLCDAYRAQRLPAPVVSGGDPCGAGDRFAVTAAGALADGAGTLEAASAGVAAASDFVRAGGAGAWGTPSLPAAARSAVARAGAGQDTRALVDAVRAEGGTVVATGGCFDLLHAGHVGMLQAARALGDCLIVCLNSDASVARLKGPGRPLVSELDRATVLLALACVDAVTIFGEDTPARVLDQLRCDVWAKGGDYDPRELPEGPAVEAWGGRLVTLPYLDGHSTSRLMEVAGHGAG